MIDSIDLIMANMSDFWHNYTWIERLQAPIYAGKYAVNSAYDMIDVLENRYKFITTVVVILFVIANNAIKNALAKRWHYVTFINVHNPLRKAFDLGKVVFWGIFAPYYPLYYVATKALILVPAVYLAPFFIIYATLINKTAMTPLVTIQETSLQRYKRSL